MSAVITKEAPPYMKDADAYWYKGNCEKFGLPIYKNGYWFWSRATVNNWGSCTYFTANKAPCKAWDPNGWSVPPYQKDEAWPIYAAASKPKPPEKPVPPPPPLIAKAPKKVPPVDPKKPIPMQTSAVLLVAAFIAAGATTYKLMEKL